MLANMATKTKIRKTEALDGWPDYCPDPATSAAFLLLQERYVLFIIHALLGGPLGFNELNRRATGVSPATLSQRLERLEAEGLVVKQVLSAMPPRTLYSLTPEGQGLRPVLDAIGTWAGGRERTIADEP
jgi:DNA-binding HxlR family transcriptional regulator